MFSVWKSQADLDAHFEQPHVKAFMEKIKDVKESMTVDK